MMDTIIYIEAENDVTQHQSSIRVQKTPLAQLERHREMKVLKNFQAMQGTRSAPIRPIPSMLSKMMATANVDKVTLEFGVKVAGEGGVPYITKGSGECNLKITVECSFGEREG